MGQLNTLADELIAGHPDTGAYDADDAVAAAEISAVNRTLNRELMPATEVLNALDPTELAALDAAGTAQFWNLMSIGDLNPFGVEATLLTTLFGGGSATITALAAARKTAVSRATEIGLPPVHAGTVQQARAL